LPQPEVADPGAGHARAVEDAAAVHDHRLPHDRGNPVEIQVGELGPFGDE
jgi:hypothetical protein